MIAPHLYRPQHLENEALEHGRMNDDLMKPSMSFADECPALTRT